MYIKNRMTKDVATVSPDDSISKAFQVLTEKNHSQLPVVDKNNKLVGFITEKLLAYVSPSKATTLSVFEINYLLSKTKVSDIMKKDIFTIHPNALIEEAALIMTTNDIGSLPVIEDDKTLVGIVTRLDIFKSFIEIMGVNDPGTRIALEVEDESGTLAEISSIIKKNGANINHVTNYVSGDKVEVIVRVNILDVDNIIKELEEKGYSILSVTKRTP